MDLASYQRKVFDEVKDKTSRLLSSLGYSAIKFIPVSALEGDNIYKPSTRMEWHQGPTLIQALDGIEVEAVSEKPLRFVVQDVYHLDSENVAVGRVESGTMRKGDELIFQPSAIKEKVERIRVYPTDVEEAKMGDSVGIVIGSEVRRGDVGGRPENPPTTLERFLGEVVLLEGTLKKGDEFEINCGAKRARCQVEEIKERINSETGEVMGKNSGEIGANEAATIIFATEPLVLEKFSEIPELGRFVIARKNKNVGAGVVLEI
jgi:elongation factor 1-alpha